MNKAALVLIAGAFLGNALATQTRVFFFVKSPNGGAKFRIKCVQNPPANRCPVSFLKKTAKELCENNKMALSELSPFSCLNMKEDRTCKYANGDCAPMPKSDQQKKALGNKVESSVKAKIPATEDLPAVEDLPEEVSSDTLRPIKNVGELEEIKPLPDKLPEL